MTNHTIPMEDGASGPSLTVAWYMHARSLDARVEMFHDCWRAFTALPELFEWLGSLSKWPDPGPSVDDLKAGLVERGYVEVGPSEYSDPGTS